MFCKKCGYELEDDAIYCSNCGEAIEGRQVVEDKPAQVWKVFAKVSKVLGIVSICTCFIPMIAGLGTAPIGVVLGMLGEKAKDKEADEWRKLGVNLSVIGGALSFVSYILIFVFASM